MLETRIRALQAGYHALLAGVLAVPIGLLRITALQPATLPLPDPITIPWTALLAALDAGTARGNHDVVDGVLLATAIVARERSMTAKRGGRRSLIVLLLAGSMAIVLAPPAAACSCAGQTVAAHVAEASAVYVASPRAPDLLPGRSFRVERILKGPSEANVRVPVNTGDGAACGTQVRSGPRLVSFVDAGRPYELSLCTEFLEGDEAVEEARAVLGEGRAAERRTDWPFVLQWLLLDVAGAGAVGAVGFGWASRQGD